MHELSIAYSLTEIAGAAVEAEGIEQVEAVHLKLGALSGVIKDALLFSYDIATKGTILAGSKLIIHEVPVIVKCATCGEVELPNIQSFRCPHCDTLTADIRQGKEVEIISIEYREEDDPYPVDSDHPNYDETFRA